MKCDMCGHASQRLPDLRKHKRNTLCQQLPKKKEILRAHKVENASIKQDILSPTERATCKCDNCGHRFSERTNLRKHKKGQCCTRTIKESKLAIEPSKCFICGQGFNSKGNLQRHKLSRHKCEPQKTKESTKQRYSPSVDMLDSTIDELMKDLSSEMVEPKVENLNKEVLKQESNLVVCGTIPTSSGRISVVRPKDMLPKAGSVESGLAKLQKLAPRLLRGDVSLATVIGATRLPPTLLVNWVHTLHLSLPPE